jgi:hypothetical protein
MSQTEISGDHLNKLIDAYLTGSDEHAIQELQEILSKDEPARRYFVRYCRMHTDLQEVVRAGRASKSVFKTLEKLNQNESSQAVSRSKHFRLIASFAAAAAVIILFAAAFYKWHGGEIAPVAWIVNAQDCQWNVTATPDEHMQPGKKLVLERGFAELTFASGATILLEAPASIELVSNMAAKLQSGKLTAHVPQSAHGFRIESPNARIIDIGTEFGISVSANGVTEVYVFKGEVQATSKGENSTGAITLKEKQGARIDTAGVVLKNIGSEAGFVRQIAPSRAEAPRTLKLDFVRALPGTLRDANGTGTGFTQRLPGTGGNLLPNDANLKLNSALKQLEISTTNSDINRKYQLAHGEYLGFRLSDLGFTGDEDFIITATIPNIPAIKPLGQFGLFAGTKSDCCIRGGLISRQASDYKLFMVNNNGGDDSNAHFVGVQSSREDMRMSLHRVSGKYSLTVENLTSGGASTVSVKHPDFLDRQQDLYVGLFGANTQSEIPWTLVVRDVTLTISTPAISESGAVRK